MWQDEFIKLNQKGVRYVFPKEIERAEVLDISNFADFVQKRDESVVKAMKEFGFRLPEKTESLNDYFMELENVHQIDEKGAAESNTGKNQTIEKEINGTKYTMTIVNDKTSLPYAILYTDKIKSDTEMIVETINLSGNKNITQEEIENMARRLFIISDKAPVVILLIPQSTPECDVQQLAKECFTNENGSGQRIDLQVLDCIQDAKKFIEETVSTKVKDKVFLNGYSASGVFAQRFALIHPEIVHRCCIGGAAGSIPIPNEELGYPLGIKDYKELFGKEFDESEYKKIDFSYYVGQGEAHEAGNWDTNGNAIRRDKDGRRIDKTQIPAPMHDMSYKGDTTLAEICERQREIYGEDLNSRFINSLRYYKDNDYNIKAKIYRGIGHKGIFDSRMNPFAGVVISDIRNFYENGEGFLQDNTSTNRIDMSEQTRREKRNEHSNEANISDYE